MVYKPTENELCKGLDAIYYEIERLLESFRRTQSQSIAYALLESRLLHVRNLLDMFAHAKKANDDILASHYGFPLKPVLIDQIFESRLNKDLAHLTYSRIHRKQSEKPWPPEKVVLPVLSRCIEFIDHILEERQTFGRLGPKKWESLRRIIRHFQDNALGV